MTRERTTPLDPNRTTVERMVVEFGLREEVAVTLTAGRPYLALSSVLRAPGLCARSSFRDIDAIMIGARETLPITPRPPVVKRAFESHASGAQYGETVDALEHHAAVVAAIHGAEQSVRHADVQLVRDRVCVASHAGNLTHGTSALGGAG